jgi:hypothetical protein
MSESNSILTADFGSVYTRVLLIAPVDGVYQVVARAITRSTNGFPINDVALGLQQAIKQIEAVTGRKLLTDEGTIIRPEGRDRRGVDHFLATSSSGRSLRTILIGLMPDVSLESGRNAVEGNYIDILDTLSLRDNRDEEDQLNAVILNDPDLLFITGGTDGGAVDPLWRVLNVVKLAVASMDENKRPIVIYAGNNRAIQSVQDNFEPLTRVFIADNVRPTLKEEFLRSAQLRINQAFDTYKEGQEHGFRKISSMSSIGLLPTAQSYRTISRYLGTIDKSVDTLVVLDVGSASSVLSTFQQNVAEESKSQIRTEIGIGQSAPALVDGVDIDRFRRWIPFAIARADLVNYALNKRLRPGTLPSNHEDLYLEHALLRVGVETMLEDQRPDWRTNPPQIDRIIGAGSTIAEVGTPALAAMLLLDALQPHGITELYTDPNGLVAAMGALTYIVPEAVVQLAEGDSLDYLGTAFSLEGLPRYGEKVGKYQIEYKNGEKVEGVITGGAIYVIPLALGRTATIRISGLRRGVRLAGRSGARRKVRGGAAGLIIDARGRPIPLELELADRARYITAWYEFVSGVEHPTPDEAALEPVLERYPPDDFVIGGGAPTDEDEAPARRGLFGRRKTKLDQEESAIEAALDELLDDDDDLDLNLR